MSSPLGLIGNTPLVRIDAFDAGPCELFLKLESQNPGGSIKDRMAASMIEAGERAGYVRPGTTLVEATAGNTGIGLALVAAAKGYRLILTIPDKMSQEKIAHCRALGAEVVLTRSDVDASHPDHYVNRAMQIARDTPGAWHVNQFKNPANPLAHETTTGPEIWQQMEHRVDAVVCGVGSGGTLTGLSRFFARVQPAAEMVLADPVGSALAEYVRTGRYGPSGSYLVEGIGQSCAPEIADLARVRKAYSIPDAESMHTTRELLRRTGILAGPSTGTLLAAALRYCREQNEPKRVVTFACDTGAKYLSKVFNDYWMMDQGFLQPPATGGLRDLLTRRYDAGAVITVGPDDTLLTAFRRMQMADISQVPVMENGRCVGVLDESDLLVAVHNDERRFSEPVRTAMSTRLETISPEASIADVYRILDRGLVALVVDGERFVGLITRTDLLNHLRRRMQ
ncbi:MAG TPA: pyridoxal-phosphate dependent enzyme [Bryobacteraceae bacterium]|jgi:cystathionine beta-synthase|nr:pyridoxal-phosphate dependent enzyme [Bryobacteraceae bacterium]